LDVNDILATYKSYPPEKYSKPYEIEDAALAGKLDGVQRKYLARFKNIRRSWARLVCMFPEGMVKDRPLDVLEMSTAHGATLEILRDLGHHVVGTDFSNDALALGDAKGTPDRALNAALTVDVSTADWPYRPIIESLGLDVRLFDAGHVPDPLETDAFDVVMCFDALEHYCHPEDWMKIINEFCRIARKTVIVEINPIQRHRYADKAYTDAVNEFVRDMLTYDNSGFVCVFSQASFNQPRFFKLMRSPENPNTNC